MGLGLEGWKGSLGQDVLVFVVDMNVGVVKAALLVYWNWGLE